MGQPSMAIYVNELFRDYDVQSIVRVGSCGAVTEDVAVRDVIIASGACTDSSMNRIAFHGLDYAPVADFGLLRGAVEAAEAREGGSPFHVGLIFSSDSFYAARPELLGEMVKYGVLGVEMEASALYTLAAKHRRKALVTHFGSLARLKEATVDEITAVPGIGVATAKAVLEALGVPPDDSGAVSAAMGDDQSRASG